MPRYPVEPAWETVVPKLFSATVSTHTVATRWSYTVPAGRYAVVQSIHVAVGHTPAASDARALVDVLDSAGTIVARLADLFSATTHTLTDQYAPHVVLDEGEGLRAQTINSDANPHLVAASATIIEIVK